MNGELEKTRAGRDISREGVGRAAQMERELGWILLKRFIKATGIIFYIYLKLHTYKYIYLIEVMPLKVTVFPQEL